MIEEILKMATLPEGEVFIEALPAATKTNPFNGAPSLFHLSVYLSGLRAVPHCAVFTRYGHLDQVAIGFSNKYDRRQFREWIKKYRKHFEYCDFASVRFPTFPTSGSHRIHIVEMEIFDENGMQNRAIDKAWVWIAHNLNSQVYICPTGFAFTNLTESVMFALMKSTFQ